MAEKLKQEGRAELSQAELTEELEDEEGNVYNRKVELTFLASSSFHDTDHAEYIFSADIRGLEATRTCVDGVNQSVVAILRFVFVAKVTYTLSYATSLIEVIVETSREREESSYKAANCETLRKSKGRIHSFLPSPASFDTRSALLALLAATGTILELTDLTRRCLIPHSSLRLFLNLHLTNVDPHGRTSDRRLSFAPTRLISSSSR